MELVALWDSDSACRWDCLRPEAGSGNRGWVSRWALARVERAGVVDDSLSLVEAEFDEESGGVDAVAGLEVGELALHGGDEELDDEPAVLGFLGDDVGEIGHIFYFRTDGGECQRGMVTRVAFRFRWFIFMDAQDLQDFEREGFLDSGPVSSTG